MKIDLSSIVGRWGKSEDLKTKNKNSKTTTINTKLPAKGSILKGQIANIQLNKVSILLIEGELVEAKLTGEQNFVIGDELNFLVKDTGEELLLLEPLLEEGDVADSKLENILKGSGLEITPKNKEILTKLISNNMPINNKVLSDMSMFSKRFPEAKIDHLVFLMKNDIMISKDSIHYVDQLLNHKHSMSADISNFNTGVSNMVDKTSGALVAETILKENELSTNVFTKIRNFFQKPAEEVQVPKEKLDFPMKEIMSESDSVKLLKDTGATIRKGSNEIINRREPLPMQKATVSVETLLDDKSKAFSKLFDTVEKLEIPEDVKQATNRLLAQRVTKSMLNNELMMKQNDINDVVKINKHYNKVYDRMLDVLSLDLNDSSESIQEVLKEAGNIKTNMEMMNQLQENHQFVHLPIVLNEQNVDSELYIMNNKKSASSPDERITALIRLDLRNLGQLDIYVAKTSSNVEINFYVEGENTIDHIKNNSSTLVKKLVEKSFNVLGVGVTEKEKEFDIVEDFLNFADSGDSNRFSFDMRA